MKNFEACLKPLLEHEGGNDDDPQDPGGRTSRGIIQTEYDKFRDRNGKPRRDVWSAADDEVREIYRKEYWDPMRCDELPAGVDYCVFDYGVNSGISRSAKVLQKVVGVDVDGEIGPSTVKAANSAPSLSDVIAAISDERLKFLKGLHTWPRFGRGWSTRVAEVKATSIQMVIDAPATPMPGRPAQPAGGWLAALIAAIAAMFRSAPAKPPEPPAPAKPVDTTPAWMLWANKEVGFHETGQNHGIDRYISLAKCGSDGDPWCSIFVNAALEACGVHGSRSAMARSFEHDPNFVKLDGPACGAITTMWRQSKGSGLGHVFFYAGENDKGILALGGNQSDEVCRQYEPRDRVVGYFWPKSVQLPATGRIVVKDVNATTGTES